MYGDEYMLALCVWREARSLGRDGMRAVGCVIRNRVNRNQSSYYREVVKPWQFSSITAHNDPQLGLYPQPSNAVDFSSWQWAQEVAQGVMNGSVIDTTGGATYYYADTIPLPEWAKSMTMTVQVGNTKFYRQ